MSNIFYAKDCFNFEDKGNVLKEIIKSEQGREEDHFVQATLIIDDTEFRQVPCKIFLPERIEEKPYLILKPSQEEAHRIFESGKGGLHAITYGFNNIKELTIEAPVVYLSGETKHWGTDIADSTIVGEPQDLHCIQHLTDTEDSSKTHITFWVSPNEFLSAICPETDDVDSKREHHIQFRLKDKIGFEFDKHFRSKILDNGDTLQWSFLVACAELDIQADDVEKLKKEVLPHLDDFLLVASFASRQKAACLGWTASDNHSYSTFYRGNYTFPQTNINNDIDNGLIDIADFQRFTNKCYQSFLQFENKLALRSALHSVLQKEHSTVETSFLHMFAGLETLVLDFRRRENLVYVLPLEKDWPSMKKYLKTCIKNSTDPKLNKSQINSMHRKLNELNRVSLKEAYAIFCKQYLIDNDDLWPVFGDREKKLIGLDDIRNKLIHGDPFPNDMFRTLIFAKEHLKIILERIMVRVLDWDVSETKINPHCLKIHLNKLIEIEDDQKNLAEYIFTR